MSDPSFDLMIQRLRSGASEQDAFRDYCWSKCVEPISRFDLQQGVSPERAMQRYPHIAMARLLDGVENGDSDDVLHEAWAEGLSVEDIIFRAMPKERRPTQGDLMRAMSLEDQVMASRFIGVRAVALAVIDGGSGF